MRSGAGLDLAKAAGGEKRKRILQTLPAALGERWSARALQLMQATHADRMGRSDPHVFRDRRQHAELQKCCERSVREHFRDQRDARLVVRRARRLRGLINPELLPRSCPRSSASSIRRRAASKLQRLLMDDRQLFRTCLETPMSDLRATRCGDSS